MANDTPESVRKGPHPAPAQVVVGLLFLLDNLGVIAFRHAFTYWPLALIAAGVALVFGDDNHGGRKGGTILIVVGGVLLLQRLGLMDIGWRIVWPLVMIAAGAMIVFRTLGPRRTRSRLHAQEAGPDGVVDVTAILGGVERRVAAGDFRGGDVTAILGGCDIDLRGSGMMKEATLDVFAFCGGVTVRVPADWNVVLEGRPLLGGFTQKTVAPPDTGKRLVISGVAVMGGVEVRN